MSAEIDLRDKCKITLHMGDDYYGDNYSCDRLKHHAGCHRVVTKSDDKRRKYDVDIRWIEREK